MYLFVKFPYIISFRAKVHPYKFFWLNPSEKNNKMSIVDEGLQKALKISEAIILPMVIKTALELNLFEIMAKSPGGQFTSFDLSSRLPKQTPETPAVIERILRFLASQSVISVSAIVKDGDGGPKVSYGMTPRSNNFVPDEDGTSRASVLFLLCDKVFVDLWYHLKDAIVDGGTPFEKAHGMEKFKYLEKDNRFSEVYNKSMHDETRMLMKMMLENYKGFEGVKEVVDVGGGLGANLELIVSKYPNIKGINFDLPHVIEGAPPYSGVEHVSGNMFDSVPKGEVIFLKWILHDWGDDCCIKILKNCWEALPENNGKVVVVEMIVPDLENNNSYDKGYKSVMSSDMIMLLISPDGKERTITEYNALAKEAGFTSFDIAYKETKFSIMEFYKKKLET